MIRTKKNRKIEMKERKKGWKGLFKTNGGNNCN